MSIGKWYQNGNKRHQIQPQPSCSDNLIESAKVGTAPSFTQSPLTTNLKTISNGQKRQQSVPLTNKFDGNFLF